MEKKVGQAVVSKSDLLEIAGVYENFIKGEADQLTWQREDELVPVLDLVGGFGSTILGHNHPEILDSAVNCLSSRFPVHVQGSKRVQSHNLKEFISQILKENTGRDHRIMLLNTGTEAVEAAIKHAEYEYALRIQKASDRFSENIRELESKINEGKFDLNEDFYMRCEGLLNQEPIEDRDSLCAALAKHNMSVFNSKPVVATFKGDFHGKTKGSLAFTWNRDARLPFIRNNKDEAIFVDNIDTFIAQYDEMQSIYYEVDFTSMSLSPKYINRLAAFIYEPIQGEGGIRPLTQEQCQLLNTLSQKSPDTAFIADEIQCGLGRSGNFLESTAIGTPANYITLAKSLGGGIAKVSALAIETNRFREEFDLLHSSTFSDDPLSSTVAKKTLEIILRDNTAERCKVIGDSILQPLNNVINENPMAYYEVRGKGCMIGLEIANQELNKSATISSLYMSKMLTMVIAGYLLHRHQIRILPSLGNRNVLRIQPSSLLQAESVENMVAGFTDVANILNTANAGALLSHLIGAPNSIDDPEHIIHPQRYSPRAETDSKKVGFISHFIDKSSLLEIDPSLKCFDEYEIEELNNKVLPIVEAQMIAQRYVTSPVGRSAELYLYGIQMDAESIETDIRFNKSQKTRNLVEDAYLAAREEGCSIVGFGGYTSIVSNNCTQFSKSTPAVTSGNALTVASSMSTVKSQAQQLGIPLLRSTVAILGATGNIGEVHARLLAEECAKVILVGRQGSESRLRSLALQLIDDLSNIPDSGSYGELAIAVMDQLANGHEQGVTSEDILERCIDSGNLVITEDINDLVKADIIISATNASKPIIHSQYICKDRPVLINDVAVPRDVSATVSKECPNAKVMRGGLVYLTHNPTFTLPGMLLEPGYIYACAAETILLSLAGINSDFSVGAITPQKVKEISKIAEIHGFKIDIEKNINVF